MRNQTHPLPVQYSSYENARNGRSVYYLWLAPYNGDGIDKRKPIRPQPGMPAIGTFRVNTPNFEKESLTEPPENGSQRLVYSSLAMDNECLNMTSIELRVEDYYLLRTCGPNSDLYKIINDKHTVPPFNIALHTEYYKHHNIPLPNLVPPNLNKAYPLNAKNGNLRMGNQLTGSNPFSQGRVIQPGRNFGTSFGLQGQQPSFGGNSNNNNNSGFLNQPKPFQQSPQNAFQSLPQNNAFSPPKNNAFQSLPPNNAFQSPAINPPANGLMKSGQGQFQTPIDRLSLVLPNHNNPNMANNSSNPLQKPPDNLLKNSSVGIPFQKNNQGSTSNAFANIFANNNGQGASNNNMFSPSMNNGTSATNNTNMFSNNMNTTNAFSSNVPNNNMFNNNFTNQNANNNSNNVNMLNNNTVPYSNMFSQPAINQNNGNASMPLNPTVSSLLPSQQVPPCQTYSNIKTPVDLFLEFFYNDLFQAIQRYPSIREILRDHIKKCFIFHERAQELTSCLPGREDALFSPLGKKHRETLQIQNIMDGLEKELLERQARNEFPEEFRSYAMLVWNELQQFYAEKMWEAKMELRHQTTEEAVKTLEEDLQQKEMFYMNRLNSLFQTDPSPLTNVPIIHLSPDLSNHYRISFLPDDIRKNFKQFSCAREEREQLARYVFRLEQMRHRLKETTMADMRERQEHLYDCQRMNSYVDLDDYERYRQKKSKDNEIMVIVREDKKTPTTAISTPSRSATERISTKSYGRISNKTLKSSPSVSEFTLNDSPASNKDTTVNVRAVFKVTVIWVKREHQDQSFKIFQVSMHLPEQISKSDLKTRFIKHIQETKMQFIRGDAEYKFGEMRKFKQSWETSVKIEQQKLNIPATYTFEATYASKDGKGTRLTSLTIENKHGKVEWKQEMDVSCLDFTKEAFSLGDNTIECNSECLNRPCRITFFSLPSKVAKLEEKYFRVEIYEKMRKRIRSKMDMELESIDWDKRHYTILTQQFFISNQEPPEADKEKQKTPSETDSNSIPHFQPGEL